MQTVILAGGLGTRLRPLGAHVPKSLIVVNGRPFLAYQLAWLAAHALREVVLCVGHQGDQIEAFAQDGAAFGVGITYSRETTTLLGTAGALKRAEELLDERFCVLNGDSYLPINPLEPIRDFERRAPVTAMMLAFRNAGRFDRSNAAVRDGFVTAYSRQEASFAFEWIDYGLRIFRRAALELVPPDTVWDLDRLYQRLIERRQLAAYIVDEPFYEVGQPDGVARFQRYVETAGLHPPTLTGGRIHAA